MNWSLERIGEWSHHWLESGFLAYRFRVNPTDRLHPAISASTPILTATNFNCYTGLLLNVLVTIVSICMPLIACAEVGEGPKERVSAFYENLPLSFEANQGQTDPNVKFISRGKGYTFFLLPTEATLIFPRSERSSSRTAHQGSETAGRDGSIDSQLKIRFVGSNPMPQIKGLDEFASKVNYILGNDPKAWQPNISSYAKVRYESVYQGIDVVYYGNQRNLEYDFVIAPGADPRQIKLNFVGADTLEKDANGDLILRVGGNAVRQHRPVVYQERGGVRREVAGSYVIKDHMQVTVDLADYDPEMSLVIDPVLSYSTYLGGSGTDQAYAVAVDADGHAYVTGRTDSINFPVSGAFQSSVSGSFDVFVAKFNTTGDALLYSTYIGGSGDDEAYGIAVDSSGNVYLAGFTDSSNFPTMNAAQPSKGGSRDGFVTKLNANGSALVYSTYLGGNGFDENFAIAIDSQGNAYVTGLTTSSNFPLVNPIQPFLGGGGDDAFIAKLNTNGSALIYSTYLGGSGSDEGFGITVDSSGNAFISGQTNSTNFPVVDALQPAFGGGFLDAFVTKINAQGTSLLYSTYLGGSNDDTAEGVAVNTAGNAYIVGRTRSPNFPTVNAVQPTFIDGFTNAFVTKLTTLGTGLLYSTYLSGTNSGTQLLLIRVEMHMRRALDVASALVMLS